MGRWGGIWGEAASPPTRPRGGRINIKDTKIPTTEITKKLLGEGRNIKEIAKERGYTAETIVNHIEQIISKFPETILTHVRPSQKDINLVKKANSRLKGDSVGKLGPIKSILEKEGHDMSWLDIRIAKLFI